MRCLIAQPDSLTSRQLQQTLQPKPFSVIDVAYDGQEAFKLGRTVLYRLVILDLRLPPTGGITTLRQLRMAGVEVPILMLSESDAIADRVAALNAGADAFMARPFNPRELVALVAALLRRPQRWVSNPAHGFRHVVDLTCHEACDPLFLHSIRKCSVIT